MKKVICAADIDALAVTNPRELVIDSGTVITPSALDRCKDLGLKVFRNREDIKLASNYSEQIVSPKMVNPHPTGKPAPITEREVRLVVQRIILKAYREAFCPRLVEEVTRIVWSRIGQ